MAGLAKKKEYVCVDRNHWIATHDVLTKCPAYHHGKRCNGEVKRVGKGSRSGGTKK